MTTYFIQPIAGHTFHVPKQTRYIPEGNNAWTDGSQNCFRSYDVLFLTTEHIPVHTQRYSLIHTYIQDM